MNATMEKIRLDYTHNGAVANIHLADGKGNVLDNVMMLEILECLKEIKGDQHVKLIVFQGDGKHFSFGASVDEHTKELAETMLKTFHRIFFTLMEMNLPTLAKISGQCLGGGMELALACNFLFADKTAKLGQPEIVLGVFAPVASVMLPEKIGLARAEDLLITGRIVDAEEALGMGLLNAVLEDRKTMDEHVEAWIGKNILPRSASSLRYGVRAARVKFNHIVGNFLPALEGIYLRQLMETKDANEGIHAFIERRQPNWQDC